MKHEPPDYRRIFRETVRSYFAPLTWAVKGVLAEIQRMKPAQSRRCKKGRKSTLTKHPAE